MKKNIIIAILAIVSIGLIGYIVYDKMNDKKEEPMNNEKEENNNQVDNSLATNYILEDFTKIIEEELELLINKKALNELTNQEKLRTLFIIYKNKNGLPENSFSKTELDNIHKNSSLKELTIEYTDIFDYYRGGLHETDIVAYKYEKNTETYTYTGALGHGDVVISRYNNLVDFKQENNKYIVSYKYIFRMGRGDGPTSFDLYYTITDALNNKNSFKSFELVSYENNEYTQLNSTASIYIEDNYESFKEKLETYNYVFEIHDGNIVLVDFYRN